MENTPFFRRLKKQISDNFKRNVISRFKTAYYEDPLEFIGLVLTFGPMTIIFILIALFIILTVIFPSYINSTSFQLFFALFVVSGVITFIGMTILNLKNPSRFSNKESQIVTINEQEVEKRKKIFVVHGHDSKIKDEVTTYLRQIGLIPVVLLDEASRGKTIIEKVEYYVDQTSFAIIILTKDDFGISKREFNFDDLRNFMSESKLNNIAARRDFNINSQDMNNLVDLSEKINSLLHSIQPRARQNVIFELGITFGYLDRYNVRVLYEEGVERPTDLEGLAYTPLNDEWKEKIFMELKAAGIECTKPVILNITAKINI